MSAYYLTPEGRRRYAKLHRSGVRLSKPALPRQRKLQALQAIGYSRSVLAVEVGISRIFVQKIITGKVTRIRAKYADAIDATYERLQDKPVETVSGNRVRAQVRKLGYAPPAAYDDINDMTERPKGVLR